MKLLMIRHPPVPQKNLCYGALDVPAPFVSNTAIDLARSLSACQEQSIALFSSPLDRCARLARAIQPLLPSDTPLFFDRRLQELSLGRFEGRNYNELQRLPEFKTWMDNWRYSAPPEGETLSQLQQRVRSFVEQQLLEWNVAAETVPVLVTHAGVIRALWTLYEGFTWEEALNQRVGHAQILPPLFLNPESSE